MCREKIAKIAERTDLEKRKEVARWKPNTFTEDSSLLFLLFTFPDASLTAAHNPYTPPWGLSKVKGNIA